MRWRSGSSAACTPKATASRRTTSGRSNISAASPTRHADDNPDTPQARFVANAFVALGHYYLDGIPKTAIKRDPDRAREMFAYAASYFGDPDAQYYLARLYLDGNGAPHDPRQAARWFGLSAQKGQYQAQAMLGAMLFTGDHVPRQAARGLMWLTLARTTPRTAPPPIRPGSPGSTTAPSSRRPTTSARWRWSISSAGCRASGTEVLIPAP